MPRGFEDPLAVDRPERDEYGREHRDGEVARELGDEDRLEKRALMDPLPSRWVGEADHLVRLGRVGCTSRGWSRGSRRHAFRGPENQLTTYRPNLRALVFQWRP